MGTIAAAHRVSVKTIFNILHKAWTKKEVSKMGVQAAKP
jgi:hypothetical protein